MKTLKPARDFVATDLIQCSLETCTKIVRAENSIWDDRLDLPYCSKSHRDEDALDRTLREWRFEDQE